MSKEISDCCASSVIIEGITTKFHVCSECHNPCNVIVDKVECIESYKQELIKKLEEERMEDIPQATNSLYNQGIDKAIQLIKETI